MNTDKEIRELFAKHSVALDRDDVWSVQSSKVVKHKALERLAAALSIQWKAPQVLRAERDEAVILVTGEVQNDQIAICEWSIGEALINANYRVTGKQAPYVYAMAEKRAKDRVILKLAGLHGVYSEDEADDFKQQPASAPVQQHEGQNEPEQKETPDPEPVPYSVADSAKVKDTMILALERCESHAEIFAWREENLKVFARLTKTDKQIVSKAKEIRQGEIDGPQQQAAE